MTTTTFIQSTPTSERIITVTMESLQNESVGNLQLTDLPQSTEKYYNTQNEQILTNPRNMPTIIRDGSTTRDIMNNINQSTSCPLNPHEWSSVANTSLEVMKETNYDLSILMFHVLPTLAVFGITGNVISIRILVQEGLKKSYNLMLVTLAVMDSCYLTSMLIYGITGSAGCRYLDQKSSFYFNFYKILQFMDLTGSWTSFMMTLFITIERLIFVFMPLKAKSIVNVKRTAISILCLVIFVISWVLALISNSLHNDHRHDYVPCNNKTLDCRLDTDSLCAVNLAWFRNNVDESKLYQDVPITQYIIYGPLPVSITGTGCVAIVMKMLIIRHKRNKMTNKDKSSIRPTLSVIAVGFVYTFCSIIIFTIHSDAIHSYYSNCGAEKMKFDVITVEVVNTLALINCSVNFVIYILLNPNFRKIFFKIFLNKFFTTESANTTSNTGNCIETTGNCISSTGNCISSTGTYISNTGNCISNDAQR